MGNNFTFLSGGRVEYWVFKGKKLGTFGQMVVAVLIGDGHDILFCYDKWIGNSDLKDQFQRLFRLEREQQVAVSNRVKFVNGSWFFEWNWVRSLTGRLCGELDQIISVITCSLPLENGNFLWKWVLYNSGFYNTRCVSSKINEESLPRNNNPSETMRNNLLPQKVGIFVWRVAHERIPVRVELDKRGIDLDSLLCPLCNNVVESVDHAIISCSFAKEMWQGYNYVANSNFMKKTWQAVQWVTGYFIWKNRNFKVFGKDSWAP
ncbi:uncharacterized protein [Rutidosis leptorrhynchoides]|uniref:uncharacterized protein n=1 Tax=Rutidosis leptorrhynchoides TaxID=125765 RepID=UPI003A99A17E